MGSRVRIAGHPLHPMLVMFPTALLPLLLVLDGLLLWTGDEAFWTVGYWVAIVGLVTTVLAIAAGIPDMIAIPDRHRAHRTAFFHAIVGTTILLAFAASLWSRWNAGTERQMLALGIDIVGVLLVTVQGWLGGELVYRYHLGVRTLTEGGDPVILDTADTPRIRRDDRRPGV